MYLEEKKADTEQHIKVGVGTWKPRNQNSRVGLGIGSGDQRSKASIPRGSPSLEPLSGWCQGLSLPPPHPVTQDPLETLPQHSKTPEDLRGGLSPWIIREIVAEQRLGQGRLTSSISATADPGIHDS